MIHIFIKRDQQGELRQVLIRGHADYAERGKDIVCAAVSGISIGMINAIEQLLAIQVVSGASDTGELNLHVPAITDQALQAKVQLLMEAMVVSLIEVADAYPQFIQININQ